MEPVTPPPSHRRQPPGPIAIVPLTKSDPTLTGQITDLDRFRGKPTNEPSEMRPIALYSLVETGCYDQMKQTICDECNQDCENGVVGVRPVELQNPFMFVGRPLQDVVEFHSQLIRHSDWGRFYFVAVHEDEWSGRGVMMVTLDSDKNGRPNCFVIAPAIAGRVAVELQNGGSTWAEAVEYYDMEGSSGSSDEGEGEDDSDGDTDNSELPLRSPMRERGYVGYGSLQGRMGI